MSGDAHESPRPIQEEDALPTRRVAVVLVAFVVMFVIGIIYAALLYSSRERAIEESTRGRIPARAPAEAGPIPPDRHLLEAKRRFVDEWRPPLQQRLEQWGWVDRDARVIHMPIEKAMDLVAREGGR